MGDLDDKSDVELVGLCNSGSRNAAVAAFETLYARHRDFVLRVALRFAPDPDAALDVLQETFTYLLRKFPPPGPGLELSARLETLLYTAAKNTALSARRKARIRDPGSGPDPDTLPAPEQEDAPFRSEADALLRGLSPAEREIVTLRFVDDLSIGDIAIALGIPVGTAKSRLHTAVTSLRKSPYVKEFFEK